MTESPDDFYPIFQHQSRYHEVIKGIFRPGRLETFAGICLAFPRGLRENQPVWIAISEEGVGTKVLVAQLAKKFDTIGIDLVAMNVNDILCLGAKPIAFADYIALGLDFPQNYLKEIMGGIKVGADLARVEVTSGETPVIPEMLRGVPPNNLSFELAGCSVGIVIGEPVRGDKLVGGDVVMGIASNGIHSNGLTAARQTLLKDFRHGGKCANYEIDSIFEPTGEPISSELLRPTHIYVPEILDALQKDIAIHGLAHITGGAFRKLQRWCNASKCGVLLDNLPDPPAIFQKIQKVRGTPNSVMYQVFNMGVGFCLALPRGEVDKFTSVCEEHGKDAFILGEVTSNFHGVKVKLKNETVMI